MNAMNPLINQNMNLGISDTQSEITGMLQDLVYSKLAESGLQLPEIQSNQANVVAQAGQTENAMNVMQQLGSIGSVFYMA